MTKEITEPMEKRNVVKEDQELEERTGLPDDWDKRASELFAQLDASITRAGIK